MKRIKLIAVILIAFTTISYGASYTLIGAAYPINVNGQKIAVQPLNLNGTTYLPLRSISEAVGVPIEWNGAKKSVEINTVDIDKLKAACVMLYDDNNDFRGSGVYIDYDQVLTAGHVIGSESPTKTSDECTLSSVSLDNVTDSATLKSEQRVKPVKIGDSDEIDIGDKVIVIAAPQGKNDTVAISKVIDFDPRGIVINATLGGGASGGAVFDMNGCLIGIIIAADGTAEPVETKQLISPINGIREAL